MAQTKRVNGTGTVYQRTDGRWVASASVDGKRVSRYRKSRREAELALAELLLGTPGATPVLAPEQVKESPRSRIVRPGIGPSGR